MVQDSSSQSGGRSRQVNFVSLAGSVAKLRRWAVATGS